MTEVNWYAVYATGNREGDAEKHLRVKHGFRTFFPHICEWVGLAGAKPRLARRAYFPNYLFVESEWERLPLVINEESKMVGGVNCLVAPPRQEALPIPEKFMDKLMVKADPLGQIHRAVVKSPGPNFVGKVGDSVLIKEGHALWNFIAVVKRVCGDELLIELERPMLGSKQARIPIEFAELLKTAS